MEEAQSFLDSLDREEETLNSFDAAQAGAHESVKERICACRNRLLGVFSSVSNFEDLISTVQWAKVELIEIHMDVGKFKRKTKPFLKQSKLSSFAKITVSIVASVHE